MKLENISWEELTNFNIKTPLKKRHVIIVELDDNYYQRYKKFFHLLF